MVYELKTSEGQMATPQPCCLTCHKTWIG